MTICEKNSRVAARFIRTDGHIFRDQPQLIFQQAANELPTSVVGIAARGFWKANRSEGLGLEWVNKSTSSIHVWQPSKAILRRLNLRCRGKLIRMSGLDKS